MNRQQQGAHRRNVRMIATALPPRLRDAAESDRYRGRATDPPSGLAPSERTRFAAVIAAWDMARSRGCRVGRHDSSSIPRHRASQHRGPSRHDAPDGLRIDPEGPRVEQPPGAGPVTHRSMVRRSADTVRLSIGIDCTLLQRVDCAGEPGCSSNIAIAELTQRGRHSRPHVMQVLSYECD